MAMFICANLPAQWVGSNYPDYGPQFWNTQPNQITYIAPYLYVANNGAYVYRTSNSGTTWDSLRVTPDGHFSRFVLQKENAVVFSESGSLGKSTNNGITFFERFGNGTSSGSTILSYDKLNYTEYILKNDYSNYLLFSNYGTSYWDTIKPVPFGEPKQFFVHDSKNYLILRTNVGSNYYTNLYKADNFTGTLNDFQKIGNGLPTDVNFPQIKIINNKFYAVCAEKGIYVSEDFGFNFIPLNNGLPLGAPDNNYYNEIVGVGTKLFTLNNSKGIYYSSNNGLSWVNVNSNINGLRVYGQIGVDNNYLYCIAYKNYSSEPDYVRLYRRPLSDFTVGVSAISSETPSRFTLGQNYPNPFNPSTKISFSIPKNEFVSIKVFDISGKEIAQLVNNEMKAGSYEYTFNGSSLASGVYFYRISTPNFTETKKMTLVK